MDLILDTHTLLWFLNGDEKLPLRIRHLIESEENTKYLSIASIWEIGIKMSLGKLIFPKGLKNLFHWLLKMGF